MLLLGWLVGPSSTALDDRLLAYNDTTLRYLETVTDPRLLAIVLAAVVGVALFRRWWRFAAVALLFPPAAYVLVQLIKPLFGRQKGAGLAYPSGHETLTVVVMGMLVLVTGAAVWAVLVAVTVCVAGMIGLGVTYHYVTDAVGGALLGTAIVCVAALVAAHDLTPVNPIATCVTGDG
jgi:hypothetical protein